MSPIKRHEFQRYPLSCFHLGFGVVLEDAMLILCLGIFSYTFNWRIKETEL